MGKTATLKKAPAKAHKAAPKSVRRRAAFPLRALHGIAQMELGSTARKGGLTAPRFKGMLKTYRFGLPVWSYALHMPQTALSARLDKGIPFHPLEADRAYMVEQVLKRGMDVFEDADDLMHWLKRKHPMLEGLRPLDLLSSTTGISWVMMELGRIEHGVY